MLANDLIGAITLEAFGAGIPSGDETCFGERDDRVILDGLDEQAVQGFSSCGDRRGGVEWEGGVR